MYKHFPSVNKRAHKRRFALHNPDHTKGCTYIKIEINATESALLPLSLQSKAVIWQNKEIELRHF